MEFTRGAWFSPSAGERESSWPSKATCTLLELSEATVAATQALDYQQMKPQQLEVVQSFVKGNDVFGVLPTEFGKGLCYGCLPL